MNTWGHEMRCGEEGILNSRNFFILIPTLLDSTTRFFFWFLTIIASYMLECLTLTNFIQMRNFGMWLRTLSCWTQKNKLRDYLLLWKTINIELVFYLLPRKLVTHRASQ